MGYKRERPIYKLKFTDPSMNGFVMRIKGYSFKEAIEVPERIETDAGTVSWEKVFKEIFQPDVFVSWNLEDENGNALPGTEESLRAQDPMFVRSVVDAFVGTIMGAVPDPLDDKSPDGSPSGGLSIPMETLSPNPGS